MKTQNEDTRYFIDLDLKTKKIVKIDYDNRFNLEQDLEFPLHRIFITKGQYNKLEKKNLQKD